MDTSTNKKSNKFDSQYQGNECHKLDFDQYYTPDDLAIDCMKHVCNVIGLDGISEFYETSGGTGAFVRAFKNYDKPWKAVDIEPKYEGIEQQDFLDGVLEYKTGRCFVGNPPFGARLTLAQKFYKKCITTGDYIAWILPISQFNNNVSMYEFDLVYSEDLGDVTFSGCKPVRCCFNIYKRPATGLNKRPNTDIESVSFIRNDSKGYAEAPYDFRIICWGGRAGQLLKDDEPDLAMVYKIKVNKPELVEKVKNVLINTDWKKARPSVSCKKIQKAVIVAALRKEGIE